MITYEYMILIINNLKISLIVIEPLYDGFDTSLISNNTFITYICLKLVWKYLLIKIIFHFNYIFYIHKCITLSSPSIVIFLKDIGFKPARRCCVNTSSLCQASWSMISLNGNSCEGYFMYFAMDIRLKVFSCKINCWINSKKEKYGEYDFTNLSTIANERTNKPHVQIYLKNVWRRFENVEDLILKNVQKSACENVWGTEGAVIIYGGGWQRKEKSR